jgi:autonomous glycyl radical cofactor GrcA
MRGNAPEFVKKVSQLNILQFKLEYFGEDAVNEIGKYRRLTKRVNHGKCVIFDTYGIEKQIREPKNN